MLNSKYGKFNDSDIDLVDEELEVALVEESESEHVFHLDPAYRNDPPKPKSVTLPESLVNRLQQLAEEDSTRSIVIRFLERYMDIVKTGNREIRKTFTDNELRLVTDVCGDLSFESLELAVDAQLVANTVGDAVLYSPGVYGEKWDVDEQKVVTKIRQLYGGGQIALIQFIETMWQSTETGVEDYFKLK